MKTKLLLLTLMLYIASHAQKNQSPVDGATITEKERDRDVPVEFRWTPITPKPQGPVVYKLKVWQLMNRQTGEQAIKSNKPIVEKEVKDITQAVITNLINGPCKPPYMCDYVWTVQAIDKDGKELGNSAPTSFNVDNNKKEGISIKNQSPVDGATITEKERDRDVPVEFRWTPITPKPQGPVVYKLKVWQLMERQTGEQAIKSNKPIVEKEVKDITQAVITNLINGPCKPPYMCDYVWTVQAIDKDGKELGNSAPTSFNVDNNKKEGISIKNQSPVDGATITEKERDRDVPVEFRWTPITPKPQGPVVYKLKVWQITDRQTGEQAIKSNKPIVEKEVRDITQIEDVFIPNSKPPFTGSFVCRIQAVNEQGKIIKESEPTSFSINNNNEFTADNNSYERSTNSKSKGKIRMQWPLQ